MDTKCQTPGITCQVYSKLQSPMAATGFLCRCLEALKSLFGNFPGFDLWDFFRGGGVLGACWFRANGPGVRGFARKWELLKLIDNSFGFGLKINFTIKCGCASGRGGGEDDWPQADCHDMPPPFRAHSLSPEVQCAMPLELENNPCCW